MILENLQIAFFLPKFSEVPVKEVWDAFGLGMAEVVQEAPAKKTGTASGSDENFSYQVSTSPFRIDVIIAPLPPTELIDGSFGIANVADAVDRARGLADFFKHNVAERVGYPKRIGVVGAFVEQFQSSIEANKKLISESRLVADEAASGVDLIFRINRRCESSSTTGLLINNVTTWQVLHVQTTMVLFATLGNALAPPPQPAAASWLLRRNLDINTVVEATIESASDPTIKIFNELIDRFASFWKGVL